MQWYVLNLTQTTENGAVQQKVTTATAHGHNSEEVKK
jgi:hypothetical protein